jgi:urea transport system permease protein
VRELRSACFARTTGACAIPLKGNQRFFGAAGRDFHCEITAAKHSSGFTRNRSVTAVGCEQKGWCGTMKTLLGILLAISIGLLSTKTWAEDFATLTQELATSDYSQKSQIIDKLQALNDERALAVIKALFDGNLSVNKSDQSVVIGKDTPDGIEITHAITGEVLGVVASRALEKVRINNSVRGKLRTIIASLQLSSANYQLRLQSARDLIKSPDESLRDLIVVALEKESIASVKAEMAMALALVDINSADITLRKQAIETLSLSYAPDAVSLLQRLSEKNADGTYSETNLEIAKLAEAGLAKVQNRMQVMSVIENLFFGVSLGSVLLLAAIGLAITFGVMGVINMAHGEMIMLGAYTTFVIQQLFPNWIEVSVIIAIPMAFLVSGGVGVVIERTVIRHLYGRPLETLLATFGISLFLQQLVRTYNSNNVPVITPDWMSGFYQVNGALSLTYNRMYIILFSLLVLGLLALLLRKTLLGLQMRAVTQNRAMANSMGIRSSWVDALTFGLGSGIAGMAGVALSQITNVGPNMGQGFIIDSFMVVVFGGVGNLLGTFFAAMGLGVVNKFLEPYSGAVLGKIFVLIFIILFIQWRPRGLFALKGRFVTD